MTAPIQISHTTSASAQSIPLGDVYVQIDTSYLEAHLGLLSPQKIAMASQRAANRTRSWLMTNLARALAVKKQLPVGGVKGRFRRQGRNASHGDKFTSGGFAVLWIGLNPVEAAKAGTPVQNKAGVKAGKYFFPHAFIAKIYSNNEKVWIRKGPERFPVIKMTIPINDAMEELLPQFQAGASKMFEQRLIHELDYLMGLQKAA